jgi:hypothetical protein
LLYKLDFEAPVWRLRVDTVAGLVAVENRDAGLLQASFSVVQAETGALAVTNLHAPENWWVGLEAVHHRMLFLHGYADRQTGQHQGIWGYDGATGKLRWALEQLRYYGLGEQYLIAEKPTGGDQPHFLSVDFRKGTILNPELGTEETHEALAKANRRLAGQFEVPTQYASGADYFNLLQDFVAERREVLPVKVIDYLETEKFIFIGYYCVSSSGKMANKLAIFTLEGDFVREECLAAEVEGTGAETFFFFRGKIFFVQNGKSLLSLVF